MAKELILIGICTYNRPVMLEQCLQSLRGQEIPENIEILFCIADNNSNKEYAIEDVTKMSLNGHNFQYIFVEKRGLSFARNAVIDCAIKFNADFIQFIDDDEIAEKGLIKNLYTKIKSSGADAVQGNIVFNFPVNTPDILKKAWQIQMDENTPLKYVATGNVIFSKKLITDWGLRFDERLALTGGEDLDFFLKSSNKGGRHIFTNTATIYETVPLERTTLKWQLVRKMRDGFSVSYVMYLNKGLGFVIRKYIIKSFKNIIIAPFYILIGTIFSKEKLKFKGQQKLFHAIGCISFICNIKIYGYTKITGN